MPRFSRALVAAALTLIVPGIAACSTPSTDAAPAAPVAQQCTQTVQTERQIVKMNDVDLKNPSPGQIGVYHDELRDGAGAYLGTVMGRYEIRDRPPSGAIMTYYTEDIFFTDGVVHSEGWIDFRQVVALQWVGYDTTGLAGAYAGKHGRREWRATARNVISAPVEARLTMCA